MTAPEDLRPSRVSDPRVTLREVTPVDPALYRHLYGEVGRAYRWTDRLAWTDRDIAAHFGDPALSLYILYDGPQIAGFFELKCEETGDVEIAYFGLMPGVIGRGLGKHLLTLAVERAWARGAARVWLHTSTLDHPHALANYQQRGFRIVRREEYLVADT